MVKPNSKIGQYHDDLSAYPPQNESFEVADAPSGKKKTVTTLVVSSALFFGAALIFTLSAMSFGKSSNPIFDASETSSSEFDSQGRLYYFCPIFFDFLILKKNLIR